MQSSQANLPTVNVRYLAQRAELLRQVRGDFDQRGFLEVQPPCLAVDAVVDAYLDPVTVSAAQLGLPHAGPLQSLYMQTSPESVMKCLLAEGAPSIYSIGPVFRAGESGPLHHPEFTMLEWYEVGGDYESAIQLTVDLIGRTLGSTGHDRVTYRECFAEHLNLDPFTASIEQLANALADVDAVRSNTTLVDSLKQDRDGLLDALMSFAITPQLGKQRPCVLADYPLTQAALAKPSERDPLCALRFEVFVDGIEIANGYDELQDAQTLLQRYRQSNQQRLATGKAALPEQTMLLNAMRKGIPACSGVALGFDRLLMLSVGENDLIDVLSVVIGRG